MDITQGLVGCCLTVVNAVAFIVYGIDKYRARNGKWRIPEATLLMLAVVGRKRRSVARHEGVASQDKAQGVSVWCPGNSAVADCGGDSFICESLCGKMLLKLLII